MQTKYEPKELGEQLYVQAVREEEKGNLDMARLFGLACLEKYKQIGSETLEDVAPLAAFRDGIMLPNYMHTGIVAKLLGLEKELDNEWTRTFERS